MPLSTKPYLLIAFYLFFCPNVFAQLTHSMEIDSIEVQNRTPKNYLLQSKIEAAHREIKNSNWSQINLNPNLQKIQTPSCIDTSYRLTFEAANRSYSFLCSEKTADGGILIAGYGRNQLVGPPYIWYAVVTKFDGNGNHLWSREIQSDVFYSLYIERIKELSDGSIIVTGWHDNNLYGTQNFFMSKLSANGNIIWFKTFQSLLNSNCSTHNIRFGGITEGMNGDILYTGTAWNCGLPKYLVAFRLDSNGIIQWKYSFLDPYSDSYGAGIFFDGDRVTVVNKADDVTSGGDNVIHVDLLNLNYSTGALVNTKAWKVNMNYPASFDFGFVNNIETIRLNNGNYCVYGQTFGDMGITAVSKPHFAVLEFDTAYNYVRGYTINSPLLFNYSESRLRVDASGRAVYFLTIVSGSGKDKYIGSSMNGQILHQRKISFSNLEIFYDNFEIRPDGSFLYLSNLATQGQSNFYLDYFKLHNSDTNSTCSGLLTDFSTITPIQYVPYNFLWSSINPNPLTETNNQGNNSVPINYVPTSNCIQQNYCDTLHIHGNPIACNIQQDFIFTAFKNAQCGSRVNWTMNQSAIQLFQTLNDTTIKIRFNQPWQGWLHAEIVTSCGTIKDSLYLTMYPSPGAVQLGPDTTICPANSILLNAHSGYASYLWQDNSTDSIFHVTAPGIYFVETTDACGINSSDTINVIAAPPIPLDLGTDRIKCNNDTLHIDAPSGFLNYNWTPAYNISSTNSQHVIVNPFVDTSYSLIAEKTPGCFAYDTIHINVYNSPLINLGADTSICTGDSLLITSPNGFSQYQWNTGAATQAITVFSTGNYSIIGTTSQGCKSTDTLKLLNLFQLPIVNLNHDPTICENDTRRLDAGPGFLNYLWNNGNTNQVIFVNGPGIFSVIVKDNNGCYGADTTKITTIISLPKMFLPPDTAICSYGTLQIKAVGNFNQYLWNTNATTPVITISQPGSYWLQVKNNNNCVGRDTIIVSQKDCLKGLYVPTAFTPNQDGKNDLLHPLLFGKVKQFQFTVFNRWGQIVFQTNQVGRGWDGKLNGIPQDSNVFVWTCSYQFEGEELVTEKGSFVLIR